jgi:hypothetical protein
MVEIDTEGGKNQTKVFGIMDLTVGIELFWFKRR